MYQYIKYEVKDKVAVIALDNQKKMNALSFEMIDELHKALGEVENTKNVRALVIWGGQEDVFCAGGDLEDLSKSTVSEAYGISCKSHSLYDRIEALSIPTIAAVGGLAFGGGFEVALCCDFRIINEKAKFGLTEVTLGLIPGGGGTVRLPKLLGAAKAKELIFLGRVLKADEMMKLGAATKMVPVGELYDAALEYAQKLATQAPLSIGAIKKLMLEGAGLPDSASYELEASVFSRLFETKDTKEGMAAFLAKRPAVYKGE